jgi:hypothetical protein
MCGWQHAESHSNQTIPAQGVNELAKRENMAIEMTWNVWVSDQRCSKEHG